MATVVSVMDRSSFGANTDVIVVADPEARHLQWVPRDLWCERTGYRVGKAFASGGHATMRSVLSEHGISTQHGICLQPGAIEAGIEGFEVRVPVTHRLEYWYPLDRESPIEAGRKVIAFEPPGELLSGERIHQWIGARYPTRGPGSDLDRIARQKTLIAVLLLTEFDFRRFVRTGLPVSLSGPEALTELTRVSHEWSLETMPGLARARVRGMDVLLRA
jgi:hypothetical protein